MIRVDLRLDLQRAVLHECQQRHARRALEKTTIRAPFDGVITARAAQLGAYVAPGMPLLTLVEDGALEIEAEIDPDHAYALEDSRRLDLRRRDRTAPLRLLRLSPVVDPASRVQLARFAFASDVRFNPGVTGTLEFLGARGQLPAGLIVQRGEAYGVFVADGNQARFVELPNAQEGRPVAIDLPVDTPVIVGGAGGLDDGDRISATER